MKRCNHFVFNIENRIPRNKASEQCEGVIPKQWCNACLLTGGWDSLSLASAPLAPQQVLDTLLMNAMEVENKLIL